MASLTYLNRERMKDLDPTAFREVWAVGAAQLAKARTPMSAITTCMWEATMRASRGGAVGLFAFALCGFVMTAWAEAQSVPTGVVILINRNSGQCVNDNGSD